MSTQKINPVYPVDARSDGMTLPGSAWTALSQAAHDAQVALNGIIDDVAAIGEGGGSSTDSVVLKGNESFASQVTTANRIYIVRDAFSLNSATVNMPANCILRFEGGSISTGTLVLNNTRLEGDVKFSGVTISGSCANEVLTPQMFGAYPSDVANSANATRDTLGFKNLARVIDNAGTLSKAAYIPSGHYALNERIDILSSCKVQGDGETTVIDCYNGAGGLAFGYANDDAFANSCTQLECTITADAEIGDDEIVLNSASGISVGDYLIITDTMDFSFNGSRRYYRTSEAVKVVGIDGNTVKLYNSLYGNYYAAKGSSYVTTVDPVPTNRTVISKFVPKTFDISGIRMYSHSSVSHACYYTFMACGHVNSEFKNIIVENYGNHASGAIILGLNFKVESCVFKNYLDDANIYDVYGLVIQNCQEHVVTDSTFRGGYGHGDGSGIRHCHGFATGGGDSVYGINNRNFVYQRLHFDIVEAGNIDLDVHSNSEYYKYVDIYAPQITCDTGGYNLTVEGCKFWKISSSFNLDGLKIVNCEIMHPEGELLLSNTHIVAGHESSTMVVQDCTIHGSFVVNMQDESGDDYNNRDSSRPYSDFIFKNNICEHVSLRHGYMRNVVIDGNTFGLEGYLNTDDVCMDSLSIKNNTMADGCIQMGSSTPVNGMVLYNNIVHSSSRNLAQTNTVLLSNFNGIVASNVIRRVIADNFCAIVFSNESNARVFDNIVTIENRNIAVFQSIGGSKIVVAKNTHNCLLDQFVSVGGTDSDPTARGIADTVNTFAPAYNPKWNVAEAIGTPVYLKNSNRLGMVSSAFIDAKVFGEWVNTNADGGTYIGENPMQKDVVYTTECGAAGDHAIYFSKGNDPTAADFEDGLLLAAKFSSARRSFTAPDPTEYPYIYVVPQSNVPIYLFIFKNRMISDYDGAKGGITRYGTTAERNAIGGRDIYHGFCYFDSDLNKPLFCYALNLNDNGAYWHEADGAWAGVKRMGATSERPTGSNIYVGFMYNDTTIHKLIFASAISGNTVTWVDTEGNDVSV